MTKICYKLFIIISVFLLASCAAKYEKYYEFQVPKTKPIEQCVQICQKTKDNCSKMCTNDSQLCKKNQMKQAELAYDSYVREMRVAGNGINRDLNSFYDPLQCSKISCDCERDYRACYKMCGGEVIVKQRCVANCPESIE